MQELEREFPAPTFVTDADGCTVADRVWCIPGRALHCRAKLNATN